MVTILMMWAKLAFLDLLKVGLSPSKKIYIFNFNGKPFKNDEECFLFHLKSSFCSQALFTFLSWLFGHVEKMAWLER